MEDVHLGRVRAAGVELLFIRVQRGQDCSCIKGAKLNVLSHQPFSFLMQHEVLAGGSSLSLKQGSRFDSEMCMRATPRSPVLTLSFSLCPCRRL